MVDIKSNVTNVESDSVKAQEPCQRAIKKMMKRQRRLLLNDGTQEEGKSMEQVIVMLSHIENGVQVIGICLVIIAVLAVVRTINSFFT